MQPFIQNAPRPLLAFLPGWSFQASIWQSIAHEFPDCDLAYYDFPSVTSSSTLETILHTLHIQIPPGAILIGWSLGGLIASLLCHTYPNTYKKLILVATTPKFIATSNWKGITQDTADEFYARTKNSLDALLHDFQQGAKHPHRRLNLKSHQQYQPTELLFYLDLLFKTDHRVNFNHHSLPTLQLFGEEDAILPLAIAEQIKETFPGHTTHIIPSAGHALFLSHPNEFSNYVRGFIHA